MATPGQRPTATNVWAVNVQAEGNAGHGSRKRRMPLNAK